MRQSTDLATTEAIQGFFLDILKTVPVEVHNARISFVAEGIPRVNTLRKEYNEEKYIEMCRSKGVMPFSRLKLEYNSIFESIVPETGFNAPLIEIYRNSSEQMKKAAFDGFLAGGKVHLLEYDPFSAQGFRYDRFRDEYLDKIFNAGYHINDANLWLEVWHGTGYNEGTYRSSGLMLRSEENTLLFKKGAQLELPSSNEQKKEVLDSWFSGLADKYGMKVIRQDETPSLIEY